MGYTIALLILFVGEGKDVNPSSHYYSNQPGYYLNQPNLATGGEAPNPRDKDWGLYCINSNFPFTRPEEGCVIRCIQHHWAQRCQD